MTLLKDLGLKDFGTYSKRMGRYLCDCGGTIDCIQGSVKSGRTSRCKECQNKAKSNRVKGKNNPMFNSKINVIHGHKIGGKPTHIYTVWQNIKIRCYNKNSTMYHRYGGRGIVMCDEWLSSFEAFNDWSTSNGFSELLEIDRIDNDGNYEPSNCRWVTKIVNSNNKEISIGNRFTKDDLTEILECYYNTDITLSKLAKVTGMSKSSIERLVKRSRI